MKRYRVIWDIQAKESLKAIALYLQEKSPTAAKNVRTEILKLSASLGKMPERFSVEPLLENKGKEYRSVSKWSYKILYRVGENEVRILNVINSSRNITAIEVVK